MTSLKLEHDNKGVPYVRFQYGTGHDGKPRRYKRRFRGMTDDEAMAAAQAYYERVVDGLLDDLLRDYNDTKGTPNTIRSYDYYRRLSAPLANVPVSEIDVQSLNRLFTKLLKEGGLRGKPLSTTSVDGLRKYLGSAFHYFASINLVSENPVPKTIKIKAASRESLALDDASLAKLMAWLEEEMGRTCETKPEIKRRVVAFAMWLAVVTGVRVGEACALRRQDVSARKGTLTISKTVIESGGVAILQDHTKGRKTRTLDLLDSQLETIRQHLLWQHTFLAECTPNTPLVTVDGHHMKPKSVSQMASRMMRKMGLDNCYHFHSLRHSNATLLLQDGVNPALVQQRLGHADASFTINVYGHTISGHGIEAAQSLEDTLRTVRQWQQK